MQLYISPKLLLEICTIYIPLIISLVLNIVILKKIKKGGKE